MDTGILYTYFARTRVPYPTQLTPLEIRLIALCPGKRTDQIRCEVFKVSWKGETRMPDYKALSYAWGLPSHADPKVVVNDCTVKVTTNLDCALRNLRLSDKHVILWVDALCIDQNNNAERASQVSRMDEIYSNATEVIVFLGNGISHRRDTHENFDMGECIEFKNTSSDNILISQFLAKWKTTSPRRPITEFDIFCLLSILTQHSNSSNPFEVLHGIPDKSLTAMFEGLRQMLTDRWWNRIWVVQEAVVAKTITLRYGRVSAPWTMLTDVTTVNLQSVHPNKHSGISGDDLKVLSLFTRATNIDRLRQSWRNNQRPTLLSVIREFSSRKASDEHDKIYALLGLCNSETQIQPDYSLSVRAAYTLTTLDIIKSSQSLSVLSGDLGRKNRQDLPSWVPDWSATFDEHDRNRVSFVDKYKTCEGFSLTEATDPVDTCDKMTLLAETLELASNSVDLLPQSYSRALGEFKSDNPLCEKVCDRLIKLCSHSGERDIRTFSNSSFIIQDSDMPKLEQPRYIDEASYINGSWIGWLGMSGKHVATVAIALEPVYSSSDITALSDLIIDWSRRLQHYKSFKSEDSDPSASNFSGKAAFVATILSDVKKTTNRFERLEKSDEKTMMDWYRQKVEGKTSDMVQNMPAQPRAEEVDAFTDVLRLSVTKRAFFITEDGRLGLGPPSIMKGDEIHILPGGKMPFILRKEGLPASLRIYTKLSIPFCLIGDCFLYGAMDGQPSRPKIGALPDSIIHSTVHGFQKNWNRCLLRVIKLTGIQMKRIYLPPFIALYWAELREAIKNSLARYKARASIKLYRLPERVEHIDKVVEEYHGLLKEMSDLIYEWLALTKGLTLLV